MSLSPLDQVDGPYVAGEVVLLKTSDPQKTCLLVEGQDDDVVFSKFISESHCQTVICYGKENLVSAIDILNGNSAVHGYLAIKDSDFDILNGNSLPRNVVSTDGHDLEVMIMSTKALDHVIDVRVKGEDVRAANRFKAVIRSRLFELSSLIGYLRFVSHRHGWGIDIQTFRLLSYLDHDFTLALSDATNELKATYPHIDESQISDSEFTTLLASHGKHLCQGHEMILILSKIFTKLATSHFSKKVNPGNDLADRIFLAFDLSLFQTTQLYTRIKDWEANNPPYQVLIA